MIERDFLQEPGFNKQTERPATIIETLDPLEAYTGIIALAEKVSYMKQPELLKGAIATTLYAVTQFHIEELNIPVDGALEEMTHTIERIVAPITEHLDNPHSKNAARHQAIWFVRYTADFLNSYFQKTEPTHKPYSPTSLPSQEGNRFE